MLSSLNAFVSNLHTFQCCLYTLQNVQVLTRIRSKKAAEKQPEKNSTPAERKCELTKLKQPTKCPALDLSDGVQASPCSKEKEGHWGAGEGYDI